MLGSAEHAWQALRESGNPVGIGTLPGADFDTAYYQLSEAEYRAIHPRPTLKAFLIEQAGMQQAIEEVI